MLLLAHQQIEWRPIHSIYPAPKAAVKLTLQTVPVRPFFGCLVSCAFKGFFVTEFA